MTKGAEQLQAIKVLGVQVHMVEIPEVVALMDHWVQSEPQRSHHVINTGMHGIMEAYRNSEFKAVLNSADLFAPDGILMVLLARLRGFPLKKSRTGPTLMWDFGKVANEKGYKYYLYGDTEETLRCLEGRLIEAFPGLKIVGAQSPPFRSLTPEEDESVVRSINEAQPDVLWVALGAPKQERWISARRDRLNVPVVVGVGASFKFLSGRVNRAPAWLRDRGFEWLWRLLHEPWRVWRRVLIDAPQFVGLVALELCGLKKYG